MKFSRLWEMASGLVCLLAPVTAAGQSPASPERLFNLRVEEAQIPLSAACADSGSCAVLWYDHVMFDSQDEWIYGRVDHPNGQLGPERELHFRDGGPDASLVGLGQGYLLHWTARRPEEGFPTLLQEYDASLVPTTEPRAWANRPQDFNGLFKVVRNSLGDVLAWESVNVSPPSGACEECRVDVNLSLLDNAGSALVPRQPIEDQPQQAFERFQDVAADAEGRVWIVFNRWSDDGQDGDVYLRRFSADLQPLAPAVRLNDFLLGVQTSAQIAVLPQGGAVVVWQSGAANASQDGDREAIIGRHIGPDGLPIGPEFLVNNVTLSAQRAPRVASDAYGNFVVVWQSFDPVAQEQLLPFWDVKARLFRADGTPVSEEIFVNQERVLEQELPKVAFAPNGTFFATWYSNSQAAEGSREDVYARRFSASVGEELCWLAGPLFSCNLARSGGLAEMTVWQGWTQGAVPLVGDFDGDGREDLCAYREGEFRCDLDHEGRPLEGVAAWGLLGDTPLLGDVKGDGRADPCVRRKRRLLCDTARDGGFSELQMALPSPIGTPLLGDVDGDGREDLCLFEAGLWSCKTWAQGSVQALFGGGGSQPALADVDGDGLADFCVLDGQQLRCDTSRDGGAAEFQIELAVPAGARLLVGNLDGL